MNNVQCNKCGKWFALDGSLYGVAVADGLTVQYFSCPACGEKLEFELEDCDCDCGCDCDCDEGDAE